MSTMCFAMNLELCAMRTSEVFGIEAHDALDTGMGSSNSSVSSVEDEAKNLGANTSTIWRTNHNASIEKLPTEVLLKIFELVHYNGGDCARVSLGLAHPGLYLILKTHYEPGKIFDRCGPGIEVGDEYWCWSMQYFIGSFLGPDYRLREYIPNWYQYEGSDTAFLKRSIYGDTIGKKERELNLRWYDYKAFRNAGKWGLPKPFGKGEDWYREAVDYIRERRVKIDYKDFPDPEYPYRKRNGHLLTMKSYKKIMELYGDIWDGLAEWRDMVGFQRNIGDKYVPKEEVLVVDNYGGVIESGDSAWNYEVSASLNNGPGNHSASSSTDDDDWAAHAGGSGW